MAKKYTYLGNLVRRKERLEEISIKEKDENFLEYALSRVNSEFRLYDEGYRVFSIRNPNYIDSINDKILSEIINNICDKYKCRLVSLSMNEGDEKFSRKTYLFTFRK